jgi:ATP/ADP translocase
MAILFQIFNTFGVQNVQICILLALFIFSYLWVRKSWEERKKEHTRKIKLVDKIDQDGSNNRSDK